MNPPTSLGDAGRRAFAEAIASLERVGEDPELSAGAVERYAHAADMLAHCEAEHLLGDEIGEPLPSGANGAQQSLGSDRK